MPTGDPGLHSATRNWFHDVLPDELRGRIELLAHAEWLHETVRLLDCHPDPAASQEGLTADDVMLFVREFLRKLELTPQERAREWVPRPRWERHRNKILERRASGCVPNRLEELFRHINRLDALDLCTPIDSSYDLVRNVDDVDIVNEYKAQLHWKLVGRHCASGAARAARMKRVTIVREG